MISIQKDVVSKMKKVHAPRRGVSKLKLPVCNELTPYFPKVARCPQCKKRKVLEPHSMAILNGGAFLMDRKHDCGRMDERLDGFLNLIWHGAHDCGIGEDRDIGALVDVAKNCRGGQFEIYFCSTNCLRTFLNSCVDALESEVQKQKRKSSPSSTAAKPAAKSSTKANPPPANSKFTSGEPA